MRGIQAGELAGNRQENRFCVVRCEERPLGSFDGYYNFICAHHVQPGSSRGFDSARVSAQLLNLLAQRLVTVAESIDVSLETSVLL